jgi:hypothetical protein
LTRKNPSTWTALEWNWFGRTSTNRLVNGCIASRQHAATNKASASSPIPVLHKVNPEGISTVFGLAFLSLESLIVRMTLSGVTSCTLIDQLAILADASRRETHRALTMMSTSFRANRFSAYCEIFSE